MRSYGVCLPACRRQKPVGNNAASYKATVSDTKGVQYANDLDRLGQLTNRLNRSCRGSYIARAGFNSVGFAERLRAKGLSAAGPQRDSMPEKMRIAAFMRGYSSEAGRKEYR
ncbi:hypothetical protein ES703_108037 [subsurface metagenome]